MVERETIKASRNQWLTGVQIEMVYVMIIVKPTNWLEWDRKKINIALFIIILIVVSRLYMIKHSKRRM